MTLSGIVTFVIVATILAFGLYLLDKYVPGDAAIKLVIRVVVIILLVIYLLSALGLYSPPMLR